MDQLVRRINAQYKLNLSEDEIQTLAREALATEEILKPLYEVDAGQLRPVMGIVKKPYGRRRQRSGK